jgi:hypothetical protein
MKTYGGWRYSSTSLYLSAKWRWVVSFTPRRALPQGKELWYPLGMRLSGTQSRSGRCTEEKNLASAGIRTPAVAIPTELSRLPLFFCYILHSPLHYSFTIFFDFVGSIVIFRFCFRFSSSCVLNGLEYVSFKSCLDTLPISIYNLYLQVIMFLDIAHRLVSN